MFNHAIAFIMSAVATKRDDEKGATAVEYGLLVALIAAIIVVTVAVLGGRVDDAFQSVSDAIA